jgi:Predicted protease with the C-terminal PDZ domain
VTLNVVADEPGFLDASPKVLEIHRELVHQADKLFGARHFDHYDFLLSLSDRLGTRGIEHQRSSDNGTGPKYFSTWETVFISRDLLPHEFSHSWNGKYRRPADLWTPNFNVPMRDSLLWVYEGQTQYWGQVLASRAGFLTKQQTLDNLAGIGAQYDPRAGGSGAIFRTRPTIPSLQDGAPSRGQAGSAAKTTTGKECCSGWMPTR